MLTQLEILSKILAAILLPVVLAVCGYFFNESLKSKELDVKYVEIAVNVLSREPNEDTRPLRKWAVDVVNTHARVKIDDELAKLLIDSEPLPTETGTGSRKGFREFEGQRVVTRIIVSDTQAENIDGVVKMLETLGVSYHYLVGLDGRVVSLVEENDIAFHAARNNNDSIGIGLIHLAGKDYPDAQIDALRTLVHDIAQRRKLGPLAIVGKDEIDQRRQSDFGKIKVRVLEGLSGG